MLGPASPPISLRERETTSFKSSRRRHIVGQPVRSTKHLFSTRPIFHKLDETIRVLGCSEGLLHRPQLLVAKHGHERIEIGVGAQNEDAVELPLLLDLVGIDREVLVADRLEVAPKAGVADQRLVRLWRAGAPGRPRSVGCGRRCSAVPPASPSWPRNRVNGPRNLPTFGLPKFPTLAGW